MYLPSFPLPFGQRNPLTREKKLWHDVAMTEEWGWFKLYAKWVF